jgi:hypothetical protein
MYAMPLGVVPKPRSEKLRLINDLSAGEFSCNSMIPTAERSVRLDGMRVFGGALRRVREQRGNVPLVLIKSDVSRAYRLLPMHPHWQAKQVVTIDGCRHIDRCNSFGGGASCRLFWTFMSLVLWIARHVKQITDLFVYIDDCFSFEDASSLSFYPPYNCSLPTKQTRLLLLWDELGIPHERHKQESGEILRIIGFQVNVTDMVISLDQQDRDRLCCALRDFCHHGVPIRRSLREFQRMAGWLNWALNIVPMLRPALARLYDKMRGKGHPHQRLWVSKTLIRDLLWFVQRFEGSSGISLISSIVWSAAEADLVIYSDASAAGLGFYAPARCAGFFSDIPISTSTSTIFFTEALALCAGLEWALSLSPPPSRLAIFTDNSNTVSIFNSLRASEPYNSLLLWAVDKLIHSGTDLRVFHVSGQYNVIADALSRQHFNFLSRAHANVHVSSYALSDDLRAALH